VRAAIREPSLDDGEVGLGLRPREGERQLAAELEPGRQRARQALVQVGDRVGVPERLRAHPRHEAVQELDQVVLVEDLGVDHPMVLVHRDRLVPEGEDVGRGRRRGAFVDHAGRIPTNGSGRPVSTAIGV